MRLLTLAILLILALPGTGTAQPVGDQSANKQSAWVGEAAAEVEPQVIEWRHHIHRHPELGNFEFDTARLVADQLRELGMEVRTGVAKTGVVAVLEGGQPGPVVALRADMDALPVRETTGLPFASQARGIFHGEEVDVMHACGHDAHTAMLLGAATVLARHRDRVPGTVVFVFQPAEEGAADIDNFAEPGQTYGARRMVEEQVLAAHDVEAIFGMHVIAGLPSGRLFYKAGTVLNSADGFRITIHGKQSHGSTPWLGNDPVVAAAQIVNAMQTLVSRHIDLTQGMGVVSVGSIHAGTAGNVIPGTLIMEGTVRSNTAAIRETLLEGIQPLAEDIAAANRTEADVQLARLMPITVNHPELTRAMVPALERAADGNIQQLETNQSASEDFAYFAQQVPGLYVFLGATPRDMKMSDAASNHNPGFIVDDATLITGVRTHVEFVLGYAGIADRLEAGTD